MSDDNTLRVGPDELYDTKINQAEIIKTLIDGVFNTSKKSINDAWVLFLGYKHEWKKRPETLEDIVISIKDMTSKHKLTEGQKMVNTHDYLENNVTYGYWLQYYQFILPMPPSTCVDIMECRNVGDVTI